MIKLDMEEKLIITRDWYVAFSGGPDSTCLITLLKKKKEEILEKYDKDIKLSAIHVNHNLRDQDSIRDMKFCECFCKNNNIDFIPYSIDVTSYAARNKQTIEQAAREMRYDIFSRYADAFVFLGHNKDDNAETIFMNIIRGTGLKGLTGIDSISGNYVRPLLAYSKKEIMDWDDKNGIEYVIDRTNLESHYLRNYIRNEIFPLLNEKTGKDVVHNIVNMSSIICEVNSHIENEIDEHFDKCADFANGSVIIDLTYIAKLDNTLKSGVIRKGIEAVKGILKDVERKHMNSILQLCEKNMAGSSLDIGDLISVLVLQNNRLKIYRKTEIKEISGISIAVPGVTEAEGITVTAVVCRYDEIDKNRQYIWLDHGSVKTGLTLRRRSSGDTIYPSKGNGTKTLKKYLIDKKVDSDLRNGLFVLAVENEIVYIENMDTGKKFLPKKGKDVLRLEFSRI
ncbi:MAG: tRNA lysidine(34) synthetase TilS [Clostridia bacterium]